jgi:glutathione S-transferase
MYVLHIANKNYSSWSLRPWVMMRMSAIPFEERLHPFNPNGPSRDAFLEFSPTAQVPCLHDGERVIWESLAILEYLADRHEGLWPGDPDAKAFARSAAMEMSTGFSVLRQSCPMSIGMRIKLASIGAPLRQELSRLSAVFEEGLDRFGGPFLTGEAFTIVDAMYCPVAWRVRSYDLPVTKTALTYGETLRALAPMREWEAAALAERFREPSHDLDIASLGEVLEDRRVQV